MPLTPFRNIVYQCLLPVLAPSYHLYPVSVQGHNLTYPDEFSSLLKHHHVMGSVVVLSDGQHSSVIASSTDFTGHQSTPDTYFRLASLTKTACAVCVLRCIEKGLFTLQTPVNDLLVQSHKNLNKITVQHLLSHTSGMRDTSYSQSCLHQHLPYTEILNDRTTFFASPGTVFRYCNFAFGLMGSVLESVTGQCIDKVFDDLLFSPLKMAATFNPSSLKETQIMPMVRILPYHKGKEIRCTPSEKHTMKKSDPLTHYGPVQGSMFATANSVLSLLSVLSSASMSSPEALLSPASVQTMKSTYGSYGPTSPTLSYGLGLLRIEDPLISSHPVFGHQGFAYGAVHGAFIEDATNQCVIFLSGGCSEARKGRLASINHDILKWGLKEMNSWS